jgi:hypothetical protein
MALPNVTELSQKDLIVSVNELQYSLTPSQIVPKKFFTVSQFSYIFQAAQISVSTPPVIMKPLMAFPKIGNFTINDEMEPEARVHSDLARLPTVAITGLIAPVTRFQKPTASLDNPVYTVGMTVVVRYQNPLNMVGKTIVAKNQKIRPRKLTPENATGIMVVAKNQMPRPRIFIPEKAIFNSDEKILNAPETGKNTRQCLQTSLFALIFEVMNGFYIKLCKNSKFNKILGGL